MDSEKVEAAVRGLLAALGEDIYRPDLLQTPARAAAAWAELVSGRGEDPLSLLTAISAAESFEAQVIALRDIAFRSICEHHLLPFDGRVHLMYRSSGPVAGLSSFVRTIEVLSSRLQLQERLTEQIADVMVDGIEPDGVVVAIVARHGCVSDRGVRQSTARTMTIASRGSYSGANEAGAVALLLASSGPPTSDHDDPS